jgi:hypothetical protein
VRKRGCRGERVESSLLQRGIGSRGLRQRDQGYKP